MRLILTIYIFLSFILLAKSQMITESGDIKYGNEWIDYSKQYYKLSVSEDGIYRIPSQQLTNIGVDLNSVIGKDFQIFLNGKEIPIYTSTSGGFVSGDYIEFYGEKNRTHLDSFLFRDKNDILNPEYSMFNDRAEYFLTWSSSLNNRYITIENNLTGTLPNKERNYLHVEKKVINSDFVKPLRDISNHVYKSNYDTGEGFGSLMQQNNNAQFNTYNYVGGAETPTLDIRVATNLGSHSIDIKVNGKTVKNINKNGIQVETHNINLTSVSSTMDISVEGSSIDDKNSISTITCKYPREFKFLNKALFKFELESSSIDRYLEIQDFNLTGDYYVMYDIVNKERFIPIADKPNGLLKVLLPPSINQRKLVLVNVAQAIKPLEEAIAVNFSNISHITNKNYIIITARNAFDDGGTDWVEEYSNYRSSSNGGAFNTAIVYVDDIYNQFGYGIERHPQSINNFIVYVKDYFSNPEYILIIGKGLEYDEIRTEEQLYDARKVFQVPTLGYPGSDNLLAARFGNNYPVLPIGRIAARRYYDIESYLDKVISHENTQYSQTLEDKEWMKKVIHLVGGSPDIIGFIRGSLNKMGNILKGVSFGADVHTYERNSGTEQESVTTRIISDIRKGAAIVTFNGHSGVSGTDFNLSNIENDRYPVFYSLGCYSGNIHKNISSGQSEKFVLNPGGVIVYAGTSGSGFTGALGQLGEELYKNTGGFLYMESVGEIVQKSLETIDNSSSSIGAVTLNQQFTFHGDPAIKLNLSSEPDYTIDYLSVETFPGLINANVDSFELAFDVVNIGKAIDEQLTIKILRDIPDSPSETIYKTITAPKYRNTVNIKVPTHGLEGIGENCFHIFLDPDNSIAEGPSGAEENNELSNSEGVNIFCCSIINNGLEPIYPEDFSIVNKSTVELQASSYNYFSAPQNYTFQIDTTELFNSPSLLSSTVFSKGGMIKWQPNISFNEDKVYYWRVKPESNSEWKNSSFIYKQNSPIGWNQSHYYQYLTDEFLGTAFDGRKFDFEAQVRTVQIIGKKYTPSNSKICFIDGETWGDMNPLDKRPAITISAWGPDYWFRNFSKTDYNSLEAPWENSLSFSYKPYIQDNVVGIKNLLEAIPDSMTIFIYTVLDDGSTGLKPETWAQDSVDLGYNLYSLLEGYGAKKIRQMETKGTVPYIFVFKKGKGIIQEEIGETLDDVIEVEKSVPINKLSGKFKSQLIGPAKTWDKVLWQESNKNQYDVESYIIVYKLDKNKNATVVDTLDSIYELDISNINAADYPYIQLEFYAYDKIYRDPPTIDYWRVLYQGYPDGVLVDNDESYFLSDTLEDGEHLRFQTTIYNNSSVDMDPILVKYTIIKSNNEKIVNSERYPSLLANSSYTIDFDYPSDVLEGTNDFSVEINVDNEQVESNYFNNFGIRRFNVKSSSLPIKMLSFKAQKEKQKVLLIWETNLDINNDLFVVERSFDRVNFEEIGKVNSKREVINKYSYYDLKPNMGVNYYRLREIDINGEFSYSKTVSVIFDDNNVIYISPNPFNSEFVIDTEFNTDNNELRVFDLTGLLVYHTKVPKGNHKIKIKTLDLKDGIYFVEIKNNNKIEVYKIVKTSN